MKRARNQDTICQDGPAPKIQHLTHNAYSDTNIDGNAAVILGNNHGTINNHYGVQNYYMMPQQGDGLKNNMSEGEKFAALLASLTFDDMGVRFRNVGAALPDTCQWLRYHESFLSWSNDVQSLESRLLWIKGKPGSGKSTIMRETLLWMTKLSPQQVIVSYFFNARSPYHLAKSTLGMYRALLHQIMSVRVGARKIFLEEFRFKINASGIETWSETEIQNFMITLADTKNLPSLAIFIDALDEDDGDDVQQMVNFFEDLQQRVYCAEGDLRICLSSRHYPHITVKGSSVILEDQQGHSDDITRYVRTRLLGKESYRKFKLQERIMKKAAGVFLWVVLMVHVLNQAFNRGKGLSSMEQTLNHAPERVWDLFQTVLSGNEENKEECITLLRWVLYAERPLRPIELRAAVRLISSGDGDDIEEISRYLLHCSRGLVELTKGTPSTVQVIHETVREMLINTSILNNHVTTLPSVLPYDPAPQTQSCNAMIAESCLTYLSDVSAQVRLINWSEYPLIDYATRYWWQHLEKTGAPYRTRLLELASKFLHNNTNRIFWTGLRYNIEPVWDYSTGYAHLIRHRIEEFRRRVDVPFCRAVIADIPEFVREYACTGTDLDVGKNLTTALTFAVATGNTRMLELLLELEADPNTPLGSSPLGLAVQMRSTTCVRMLLEAGAVPDIIESGSTPLVDAADMGCEDIVNVLLDWGTNINSDAMHGCALFYAAERGHEKIVKILIKRGADVGLGTVSYSPLGIAALKGHRGIVEMLLANGAPVDYGGKSRDSPLELAKRGGDEDGEIIRMLLARGAKGLASDLQLASDLYDRATKRNLETKRRNLEMTLVTTWIPGTTLAAEIQAFNECYEKEGLFDNDDDSERPSYMDR